MPMTYAIERLAAPEPTFYPFLRRKELAVVLPTLREAGNIQTLLQKVTAELDSLAVDYEVIVVDDDSRDGTTEIVTEIARTNPRVRLLVRQGERGLSGAILHGWQNTDAEFLGVMDADLQHPPEILRSLWQSIQQGADLTVASRYADGGSLAEWSGQRRFLSSLAIWLAWPLQRHNCRTKDPMSGFFLVRRDRIHVLRLQKAGFKLLLEILVRADLRRVTEIPFHFGTRVRGSSKANVHVALDYLVLLLRLYRERCFPERFAPMAGNEPEEVELVGVLENIGESTP